MDGFGGTFPDRESFPDFKQKFCSLESWDTPEKLNILYLLLRAMVNATLFNSKDKKKYEIYVSL